MNEDNNKEPQKPKKLTFREKLKDKKEKAKIELIGYFIFLILVIVFARALGSAPSNNTELPSTSSFLNSLKDNYEYDITVDYNGTLYNYTGKKLGNNGNFKTDNKEYYIMNNNYYVINDGNYLLTTKEEINTIIDYNYFELSIIKKYLSLGQKEGNTYKIKVSDIILNSNNIENIIITIDEGNALISINYTSLFKELDPSISSVTVNIHYYNIDKLNSLSE